MIMGQFKTNIGPLWCPLVDKLMVGSILLIKIIYFFN
jgi:hypothetical protein